MSHYHLTLKSANAKTGPIPVSTTSSNTCPTNCAMREGCYAKSGPLALHWAKVSNGTRGGSLAEFCTAISKLPDGQLWRMNQAGDLPGANGAIDKADMLNLIAANKGKRGFTYTHKPMSSALNRDIVRFANQKGFTVNLSGNNLAHADQLADLKIGPVVVVLPITQTSNTTTPKGRKVIVCPATIRDNVSCATCQMCARQRDTIIGFPAHGTGAKKAERATITFHARA